jgi:hypothetical protein
VCGLTAAMLQGVPETVVTLIKSINEASANIPNWG